MTVNLHKLDFLWTRLEDAIAYRTVVCHRYRIQTKLKAHKTADLTRAALRMGLIEL